MGAAARPSGTTCESLTDLALEEMGAPSSSRAERRRVDRGTAHAWPPR